LFSYPFRMVLQGMHNGVGHYLGPVVLAFCPLLLVGLKNVPLERIAAALWAGVFLSNALTSQMGRFLLPILPVALALVLAAVVRLDARRWRVIRLGCVATLLVFLLFAAGTYAVYAKDFLPVVVGLESREAFLERIAPDYQICRFVNEHLAGEDGKAVVFFRHLYYLRVPFVFVDPKESWEVNPDRYQAPEQWMRLFRQLGVRWVVKAPDFPVPLRGVFEQMEADGLLQPIVLGNLETFEGWRISRTRVRVRVVIYQVARPGL